MPKMNGNSPPATIHRRLNNKELPIKKNGENSRILDFFRSSASNYLDNKGVASYPNRILCGYP